VRSYAEGFFQQRSKPSKDSKMRNGDRNTEDLSNRLSTESLGKKNPKLLEGRYAGQKDWTV
jgi:hypothetical protein